MSKAHMRKEVVSNISDAEHLAKFQSLLSQHACKPETCTVKINDAKKNNQVQLQEYP